MSNIWEFILQTISLSVAALLILIVKRILEDKLSPRWQYGIWGVLAAAALIPLKSSRYVIPELVLWIETIKGTVEKGSESAFTEVYVPIEAEHVFPVVTGIPQSLTDWIFIIYCAGVALTVAWYLISYLRLKVYISKHQSVSAQLNTQVERVTEAYNLKPCRAVVIESLPSAFVFGIFNPVLVVPAGDLPDDKVILHELMHLRYKDSIQNIFWCILRSLHWCNPVLQYVFNTIGNDMESLCDQRVLERLDGEDRRDYGRILLSMANSKYSRMPGTSSISNGGRNISRRIKAIVRFKKYPKGMRVVSICIGVILISNIFVGGAAAYSQSDYSPSEEKDLNRAMALARTQRCQTMAAACDTYAKGILLKNGVYIAAASSLDKHEELEALMQDNVENGINACVIDLYEELDFDSTAGYSVLNIEKVNERKYEAVLQMNGEKYAYCIPIAVLLEDGWGVEQTGEIEFRSLYEESVGIKHYYYEGDYGTVDVTYKTAYYLTDNQNYNDFSVDINKNFEYMEYASVLEYDYSKKTVEDSPKEMVMVISRDIYANDEQGKIPSIDKLYNGQVNVSGSASDGYSWAVEGVDDSDGILRWGGGGGYTVDDIEIEELPEKYIVQLIWDEKIMEEIEAEEVQ